VLSSKRVYLFASSAQERCLRDLVIIQDTTFRLRGKILTRKNGRGMLGQAFEPGELRPANFKFQNRILNSGIVNDPLFQRQPRLDQIHHPSRAAWRIEDARNSLGVGDRGSGIGGKVSG
jgi:hypothetical protein